jgi:hypothetical protein
MSWVFGPGSGGTPGGADQDIQFNNNGSFSGSNLLTTDGSGSLSASTHVSASTFYGDGSNLTGITASAVQVADGPQYSLQFRYDSPVSGDLSGSANFVVSSDMSKLFVTGTLIVSGATAANFEGPVIITSPEGKLQVRDTTNNYQVSLAPAFIPRVAFGTTSNELQYMYIDGGNTNRIASLNDFYIATASVNSVNFGKGFYYDISEERFGIHTKTPTHDFTVNGDLSVSSSASGSINIGEGISYVFDGVNRLDVLENQFRINKTNFYQGVSGEQTSNFNIRDAQVFLVDTNSSVVTGTLPGVNSSDDYGVTFIIKDSGGNAGTNDIVIEPSGSQNIDGGAAAKITTNYGAMTVVAISSSTNGLGWAIVSAT